MFPTELVEDFIFCSTLGERRLLAFPPALLPVIIKVEELADFPASLVLMCCTGIGMVFLSEGQDTLGPGFD